MKKGLALFLALCFTIIVGVSLLANPQILNKEVNGKKVHFAMKDGQKVNACTYCHGIAKIEKKKQGFRLGQPNFPNLKNKPQCAGPGCHV